MFNLGDLKLKYSTTLLQVGKIRDREMGKSMGELRVEELVNAGGIRVEEGNELYRVLRDILSEFQSPSHIWRQTVTRRLLKPSYPHISISTTLCITLNILPSHSIASLLCISLLLCLSLTTTSTQMLIHVSFLRFDFREQSKHTNLGCLMETHAPNLLGPSYKDPITSFHLFHKFFVQHPRASSLPSPTSNSLLSFLLCILNMHHLFVQLYWSLILKELSVSFVEPPKCILDTSDPSKHGGTWLPVLSSTLLIAVCNPVHILTNQMIV